MAGHVFPDALYAPVAVAVLYIKGLEGDVLRDLLDSRLRGE
jgi:hypothetical protein